MDPEPETFDELDVDLEPVQEGTALLGESASDVFMANDEPPALGQQNIDAVDTGVEKSMVSESSSRVVGEEGVAEETSYNEHLRGSEQNAEEMSLYSEGAEKRGGLDEEEAGHPEGEIYEEASPQLREYEEEEQNSPLEAEKVSSEGIGHVSTEEAGLYGLPHTEEDKQKEAPLRIEEPGSAEARDDTAMDYSEQAAEFVAGTGKNQEIPSIMVDSGDAEEAENRVLAVENHLQMVAVPFNPLPVEVTVQVPNSQNVHPPPLKETTNQQRPKRAVIRLAEVMYKAHRGSVRQNADLSVLAYAGPDRERVKDERQRLSQYRSRPRDAINMNPSVVVPMKSRPWKPMTCLKYPPTKEEKWRKLEEEDKERRDHELALELGYETLVGNLLYMDIPGARDLNRSWLNYLSPDPFEWGLPYTKGTINPPRCRMPEPYLAHQVKERLWKYPRTKLFHSQED
ncbi:uncharacterized protein LOC101860951 [Aplysia californica]|uniref:Uncharacterized protein LOC101860951 n=1 Tax=Aplysia californica TaxID=6500 RepID=A0ABM1W4Z6_APLCA|nr:uncharacterized protein LOC101860951 [Aplysia californica]